MKNLSCLIVLLFIVLLSCQKSETSLNTDELFGYWKQVDSRLVDEQYVTTYARIPNIEQSILIIFEEDNVFKSYDYGWCGTPPLYYAFTEGTYDRKDDVITLDIDHFYLQDAKFTIESLNTDTLKVIRN